MNLKLLKIFWEENKDNLNLKRKHQKKEKFLI